MTWAGTSTQRADIAHGAAARCGLRPLAALIVAQTASRGLSCWETDRTQASQIVQANGKHPHLKSVARSRKEAARLQVLRCVRVFPSHRPKHGKYRISAGTTEKFINWKTLGVHDPMTRGERRKQALRQRSIERQEVRSDKLSEHNNEPRPRFVAIHGGDELRHRTAVDSNPTLITDPVLAAIIATGDQYFAEQEAREDAAMLATVPARGRDP
jgi:hypothetical protein